MTPLSHCPSFSILKPISLCSIIFSTNEHKIFYNIYIFFISVFFFFWRNKKGSFYGYITLPNREPASGSAWWGPAQYCVRGPTLTKYAHQWTPAGSGNRTKVWCTKQTNLAHSAKPPLAISIELTSWVDVFYIGCNHLNESSITRYWI